MEITRQDAKSGQQSDPLSIRQLLRYASKKDKLFVLFGSFLAFITGFSWNLLTIVFGDVVDLFVNYENSYRLNTTTETTDAQFMRDIYSWSGYLFLLWIANAFLNYLILVLFPLSAVNQIARIKSKFFESLLRQDIQWFDSKDSDFASTVTQDLKKVEEGLSEKLGLAIYHASTALIAIATAFYYGWKLTLIIISLLPFLAFGTSVMNKVQASFARKEVEAYSSAGSVAEEAISAIRTVFAFGGQQQEVNRYERNLSPALRSGIKRNFMTGLGNGLMFSCLYGGLALGIWFGVQMIIQSREMGSNEYTIGTIVIVFWCVSGAGFSIGGAAPHFEAISVAKSTAKKVFSIIERKPLIDISSEKGFRFESKEMKAEIEFKDIHFSYSSRPEIKVLNGFSLHIKSGESVALVGPSGCGKSTVVQLIQRFYDPLNGKILIDGKDIKEYHLGSLRQRIGVVSQEPILFESTIWENIALGSHNKLVSQKDIEISAKEANCNQFIELLPKKYETYISSQQLSGGQKQRIAIARALINCPKILLLDEATSALDLHSESLVQTSLEKASKGRTTIIVAHRLSTIVNCDRIVFISEGKVKEMGTHEELMAKKSNYYSLVLRQQMTEQTIYGSEPEEDSISVENFVENDKTEDDDNDDSILQSNEEEYEEKVLKKFSQKRLFNLLKDDKYYVFLGLFLSLLYGLIVPIYAFIFGAFVEVFATTEDPKEIWIKSHYFSYYYICIAFAVGFISVTQMTVLGIAGERLTLRLRRMAFEAIMRQEIAFFDKHDNSCGALCARLSSDAANVQGASGSRMSIILQAFSTFFTSALLGFALNWQLSLVASLFIPFILMGSSISNSVENWELKTNKQSMEKSTKIAVEAIHGIRTVASLHREKHFSDIFNQIVETNAKISRKKTILRAFSLSFALSIVFLSYAVVFLFGGYLATRKQLESGHFFIIIETLIYGSMTVGQSSVFTSDYKKAKIAAANIFRLIDRKSTQKSHQKSEPKESLEEFSGEIRFEKIRFNYPSRKDCSVLRGLSFEVKSGETVALVGSSGCGKSTTIQLLEKFYDSNSGQIFIDGKEIEKLDTNWLRKEISLVSQEPSLFSLSIADNISYGAKDKTFADVVRAAQKANVHQFIQSLPKGYETNCGSKGQQLSGGQRQRIAIARALLREPKILLLDEATSALDSLSEKLVQQAIEEASRERTCLVIAHRLTTIKNASKIVVLQRGVKVEEGTHEELIQRKGVYHDLYCLQTN